MCNNAATLVYLANQGCISPHAWLSRFDRLLHPDKLIFELDPPGDEFEPVRFAARKLNELLGELELKSFVKTTGSRGLHIIVPLDGSAEFNAVRAFAREVAALLAGRESKRLTIEQRKNKRQGRLYLDTVRNAYAQTAIAPYAVRPLAAAPIATPLDWNELSDKDLDAQSYTMKNILRRLGQKEDAWREMPRHAVSLESANERLRKLKSSTDGQ